MNKVLTVCVAILFIYAIFVLVDADRKQKNIDKKMIIWCETMLNIEDSRNKADVFREKTGLNLNQFIALQIKQHGDIAKSLKICLEILS